MTAEYPNLQLLEYIFRQSLRRFEETGTNEIDAFVFPQTWPNTGGGFASPGYVYGQSFIKQYTTVMLCDKFAFVCFDNTPAYLIKNPNKQFMDDFNARNMKSKHDAETAYKEE